MKTSTCRSGTTRRLWIVSALSLSVAAILIASTTHAELVDFENAGGYGGDDAIISSKYFESYGLSVSAVAGSSKAAATTALLTFEASGRDGTDGFWSSSKGRDEAFSGDLGGYLIKAGTGNLSYNSAKYFKMSIQYEAATQKASGEVWDIDGKEQYQVTALDANGNVVGSLTSPVGSLNAEPWTWSFDVVGDQAEISEIAVEFIGSESTLRGFAFDNFNSTEANYSADAGTHAAPLPAAFPMGVVALLGVGYLRRRSRNGNNRGRRRTK